VWEGEFPDNLWNRYGKPPPDLYVQFECRAHGNLCSFHTHWRGPNIDMSCRAGIASVYGSDENGGGCIPGLMQRRKYIPLSRIGR
jgi:hypothetical protein